MSNDDLERLSDMELHQKLIQNGFPNMPVTETTRRLLIKRLRTHLSNEKAKQKRQSMNAKRQALNLNHVAQEQVERSYKHNNNNSAPPRVLLHNNAVGASPSSLSTPPTTLSRSNASYENAVYHSTPEHSTHSLPPFMGGVRVRAAEASEQPRPFASNYATQLAYQRPSSSSPKMYAPPPILASESEEDSDHLSYSISANRRRNVTAKPSIAADAGNYGGYGGVSGASTAPYNPHIGVVSRLLSLRDTTLRKSQPLQNRHTYDEADMVHQRAAFKARNSINYSNSYNNNSSYNRGRRIFAPRALLAELLSRLDVQQVGYKQVFIPYALMCAFVIFFVALAVMYMVISPDLHDTITENNTQFTLCSEADQSMVTMSTLTRPHVTNCIEDKERLGAALALNKELVRLLQEHAVQHHCHDPSQSTSLSAFELLRQVHKHALPADVPKLIRNMDAVEYLVRNNPQWRIGVAYNEDTQIAAGAASVVENLLVNQHRIAFALLQPRLPLACVLYNKIQRFFFIIGTGALVGAVLLVSYVLVRLIRGWQSERVAVVEHFTSEIMNELLSCASLSEVADEREVIINHLRDKLIPLNKRSSLLWAWQEALRLLEANDSRIQFGLTIRNGEEFRTAKWTGQTSAVESPPRESGVCTKQWQSPAFDNANKIANPPTPCLKIRHMFDANEVHHPNLKQIIEDAIIEKVGPRCNICDIQLDKQSCCVYVRCASEADAGIVHNEINGWWFDNRLVSIKFLRLQRYMSRFPTSTDKPLCRITPNVRFRLPSNTDGVGGTPMERRTNATRHTENNENRDYRAGS